MMVYPGHPRGNLSTHLSHTAGLPAIGAASLNSHAKIPPQHFYPCRLHGQRVKSGDQCVYVRVSVHLFQIHTPPVSLTNQKQTVQTYGATFGKWTKSKS